MSGISLKAARANKNLTQSDAGKLIGVSDATIRSWEKGDSFPDVAQLKRIEEVYDVSYNDIIFLVESSVNPNKKEA